jgi:hypothetical protein
MDAAKATTGWACGGFAFPCLTFLSFAYLFFPRRSAHAVRVWNPRAILR